jgi:hypothetical protein
MKTETEKHIDRIKAAVEEYYDQHSVGMISRVGTIDDFKEQRQHIIECGTSILCTKWKVGYPGGSFAQAVANNDLMGAFATADQVNQGAIRFYCSLIYNQPYVK